MNEKRQLAQRLRTLAEELEAEADGIEFDELLAEFFREFHYMPSYENRGYHDDKGHYIEDTIMWDASAHGYGKGRWYVEIDGKSVQSDTIEDVAVTLMRHIRSKQ